MIFVLLLFLSIDLGFKWGGSGEVKVRGYGGLEIVKVKFFYEKYGERVRERC